MNNRKSLRVLYEHGCKLTDQSQIQLYTSASDYCFVRRFDEGQYPEGDVPDATREHQIDSTESIHLTGSSSIGYLITEFKTANYRKK